MKNRIFSFILVIAMLAGLCVCPVSASTGDVITVDVTQPVNNPDNLVIEEGKVVFGTTKGKYVEYTVEAPSAGTYYVNFSRENIGSGNFYLEVTVNGETVNRKTGRTQNADGSYTFQDEVWLNAGLNTVRVANMSTNDGKVSAMSFTKLSELQFTTTINRYDGVSIFTDGYKTPLYIDPWLNIADSVATYPDNENAPFVTFDVNIPVEGYYSPAVAVSSWTANKVELNIDDESFRINDNCVTLSETFIASGNASSSWNMSKDYIFLEAGTHEVTLRLYGATGTSWNTCIGAVRFIEYIPVESDVLYGDFDLDMSNPVRSNDATVVENGLEMNSTSWIEYDVEVAEDASYIVSAMRTPLADGQSFRVNVSANGKTINGRTGRITNSDGSVTFHDELQLNAGMNTIKISVLGAPSGVLSAVNFKKLDKRQFTTTMNTHTTGRTFKAAYKSGLGVDPWLYILETTATYLPNNAPYVTFDVEIQKEGYYYPELARASTSYAKMYVDGQSFDMNGNAVKTDEKFLSSGNSSASCTWYRNNDALYLAEGTHEVTVQAVGAKYSSAGEWILAVGAVRFTEAPEQHIRMMVEAEDAKVFVGSGRTEVEFDEGPATLIQSDSDDSKSMSASTVVGINAPATDAPITMEMNIPVKRAGNYSISLLKAHNGDALSEGKLSIFLENGDAVVENMLLDDNNITDLQTDYFSHSEFGGNALDKSGVNGGVYLPEGTHKMIITFDADDTDGTGENIQTYFDAVEFAETIDVSGITVSIMNEICTVGTRTRIQFTNENGLPVYANKLGTVTYRSSDDRIATINDEGIISGVRIGNVVLTVNLGGETFQLPMSVSADNGLVIKNAELTADGNIEIIFKANRNERFDILVVNYDKIDGKKTSIRGIFDKERVTASGDETTVTIAKPVTTSGFGALYEIYIWDNEAKLIPVYTKIQIK